MSELRASTNASSPTRTTITALTAMILMRMRLWIPLLRCPLLRTALAAHANICPRDAATCIHVVADLENDPNRDGGESQTLLLVDDARFDGHTPPHRGG